MVRDGLSPTTARGARTTLRMIRRHAERDSLVALSVAALARPPRIERHELEVLTADETRRLLDGTVDDDLGPIYALAPMTGMRPGEISPKLLEVLADLGPVPAADDARTRVPVSGSLTTIAPRARPSAPT